MCLGLPGFDCFFPWYYSLVCNKILRYFRSYSIERGSYMSAYVLLNLSNELGKRDKMRG